MVFWWGFRISDGFVVVTCRRLIVVSLSFCFVIWDIVVELE